MTSHTAAPDNFKRETERFRPEAESADTSPQRLRDIAAGVTHEPTLRAIARNPNTPAEVLWQLASRFPREVLGNPVLPLLHLENFDVGSTIPAFAAQHLLCVDELPSWMLDAFQRGPNNTASLLKEDIENHY